MYRATRINHLHHRVVVTQLPSNSEKCQAHFD